MGEPAGLGMQLVLSESEELGHHRGLDLIPGVVRRFDFNGDPRLKVPHMGWNEVAARPGSPLFAGVEAGERFYFLHTYHVQCDDPGDVLATSDYPDSFACAVRRANIWGVQFHPEKSHAGGVTLLKNFAESC